MNKTNKSITEQTIVDKSIFKFLPMKQKIQRMLVHFWVRTVGFLLVAMIVFSVTIVVSTSVLPYFAPSISKAVGVSYQAHWLDVVILLLMPLSFIYAMVFVLLLIAFRALWKMIKTKCAAYLSKFDAALIKK